MPEITEETLQSWARLSDYSDSHGALEACVALDAAIAEIRRLHGEVAALVALANSIPHESYCESMKRANVPQEMCTCAPTALRKVARRTLASLSEAAAARDKRLRAEGAAEALRLLPCSCRTVGTTSEDAAVITCQCCFALSGYEAARLREEAER